MCLPGCITIYLCRHIKHPHPGPPYTHIIHLGRYLNIHLCEYIIHLWICPCTCIIYSHRCMFKYLPRCIICLDGGPGCGCFICLHRYMVIHLGRFFFNLHGIIFFCSALMSVGKFAMSPLKHMFGGGSDEYKQSKNKIMKHINRRASQLVHSAKKKH